MPPEAGVEPALDVLETPAPTSFPDGVKPLAKSVPIIPVSKQAGTQPRRLIAPYLAFPPIICIYKIARFFIVQPIRQILTESPLSLILQTL